ncbi:DUF6461 domain-containing protein [Gordonia sp. 'Campus']|uniref:DUF6461 domain-containing protein n=1 Tax=Gordonia sp. 'Campus' TaxID=2915824 RepID=UPI001EE3ABF7|nr:DUF6461 domain-containing protein [Gordonia sp. 'Campus']
MAYTYRDFGWLSIDYPWTTNAFSLAYISNAEPGEVIAALTTRSLPNTTSLEGVNETSWDHFRVIGAAQLDTWTITVAPTSLAAGSDTAMADLSRGREIVSLFQDVEALSAFTIWRDGTQVTSFDPLLRTAYTRDPNAGDWPSLMQTAGLEPDPYEDGTGDDGLHHIIDGSLAMAANHTGLAITPEFLRNAEFTCGEA